MEWNMSPAVFEGKLPEFIFSIAKCEAFKQGNYQNHDIFWRGNPKSQILNFYLPLLLPVRGVDIQGC